MNDKPPVGASRAFDPASAGWEPIDPLGFGGLVGPLWRRHEEKTPRFGFVAAAKHLNFADIVHGGMLTTFADQAMGMTAHVATGHKPHATIELNVQFVGVVRAGEFVEAQCEVVRITRAIIFMQAKLSVSARIVANASGIWKIFGEN